MALLLRAAEKSMLHPKTKMEVMQMNIPGELKYTRSHEWVRFLDGEKVQVGISDFVQDELGAILNLSKRWRISFARFPARSLR